MSQSVPAMQHISAYSRNALFTLLWLLVVGQTVQAQVPRWQTLVGIAETTRNGLQVKATTVDANGNVFLVGRFGGTVSFGGTVLTSGGVADAFVAKWSPVSGAFVWAHQVGGPGEDEASAVAVSGANVYVGGFFRSTSATFGSLTLTNSSTDCLRDLPSDLFVTKLVDAGNSASFTWAQRPVGNWSESCNHLVVNGNQVYMTGYIDGIYFVPIPGSNQCVTSSVVTFGTTTLRSIGPGQLGFVAKLIDTGGSATFGWAQTVGGNGMNEINDLVLQGSNVYLAGSFQDQVYGMFFGPPAMGSQLLVPNHRGSTGFVLKLNDAGPSIGVVWAQRVISTSPEQISRLAVRGADVFIAGDFSGVVSLGTTTLTTAGGPDVFVAKLADSGNSSTFTWAQRMGGADVDEVTALAVQGTSLYLTGTFTSATADFGSTMCVQCTEPLQCSRTKSDG